MFATSPQKHWCFVKLCTFLDVVSSEAISEGGASVLQWGLGSLYSEMFCVLHRGLSYRTICFLETHIIHWEHRWSVTATLYPSGPVLALYVLPANHVKNCSTASACTESSRKTLCRQRAKLIILLFANKMLGCWPFLNKRKTSFRVCVRQSFFNESSHTPFH